MSTPVTPGSSVDDLADLDLRREYYESHMMYLAREMRNLPPIKYRDLRVDLFALLKQFAPDVGPDQPADTHLAECVFATAVMRMVVEWLDARPFGEPNREIRP